MPLPTTPLVPGGPVNTKGEVHYYLIAGGFIIGESYSNIGFIIVEGFFIGFGCVFEPGP